MSPPDTDPWTSTAVDDTDPGGEPTIADGSDEASTRELAPASVAQRVGGTGTGTDPGLGHPMRNDAETVDGATEESDEAAEQALADQLRRLGGRAPQLASIQANSAGRGAARYAAVAKPAKSRAVARTEPLGVIVVPDTQPPAARAVTEPMLVAARVAPVARAPVVDAPPLPRPTTPFERTPAREQAPRADVETVPRARPPSGLRGLPALLVAITLLAAAALALVVLVYDGQPPAPAPKPSSTSPDPALDPTAVPVPTVPPHLLEPRAPVLTAAPSVAPSAPPPRVASARPLGPASATAPRVAPSSTSLPPTAASTQLHHPAGPPDPAPKNDIDRTLRP